MFEEIAGKGKCGNPSVFKGLRDFGFRPITGGVTRSQIKRATNCAIPGYLILNHYSTKLARLKDFSVCGHSCGQSRFCAAFGNRGKSRKRRCHKTLRRFTMPRPGYRHGTPKAGALPTALHPVIQFIYPVGRILPNVAPYQLGYTRIFNFCHYTTTGEKVKGFPAAGMPCA